VSRNMTPPKKIPGDSTDIIVQLGKIQTQTDYIAKSVDTLSSQLAKTEEQRIANWIEYKIQHERVVESAMAAAKKAEEAEGLACQKSDELEKNTGEKITEVRRSFLVLETEANAKIGEMTKLVNDLKEKISPLLVAHRILVWVTIFFASSIGLLLWGIFTHTVAITFKP